MSTNAQAMRSSLIRVLTIVLVVCLLVLLRASTHVVKAGERAVVFNSMSGVRDKTLGEGLNLITPFLDHPRDYVVRTTNFIFSDNQEGEDGEGSQAISAKTSDAQAVFVDITVRYHLDPANVHVLHQEVGPAYEAKIIKPNAGGAARRIIAAYNAEQVFSGDRLEIEGKLTEELAQVLAEYHIILDGVMLRNVRFTDQYHAAIEQKQIQLQRAQKKRYDLERERAEKTRKIIEARGKAAAIETRGRALADYPAVVQYEYIDSLPDSVPCYVINGQTIISMGDLFGPQKPAAPQGQGGS